MKTRARLALRHINSSYQELSRVPGSQDISSTIDGLNPPQHTAQDNWVRYNAPKTVRVTYLSTMVYKGRPSAGCENCRKTKKRCDQGLPACGRCIRLGKACGGYRDVSDLMFRNETASVTRRASAQSDPESAARSASSTRSPSTRRGTPEIQITAKRFFFDQFVTAGHLSFLEGVSPDEFLLKPIMACALVTMANRENDESKRETARRYYVEAITATNTALRHSRRAKEDNTLVSVILLSMFERLDWECGGPSGNSWRQHIEGAAQVLQFRGRSQIRTKTGACLFRELRNKIIMNALTTEKEVPEFIVQWTQALEYDAMQTPADQLAILSSRVAAFKAAFTAGSKTDEELAEIGNVLEKDLLDWSESTLAAGSVCSFHNITDLDSPHAWNGTRHEYGIPQAHRHWNMWRGLRIILSRLQEAIWRRSWPSIALPTQPIPDSEHYTAIRNRMVNDICVAAAYALGNDLTAEPPKGAVSSGYLLVMALTTAATCLLDQLAEPIVTPGGSRMILVDEPLHLDLFNQTSTQLAWIIERLEYIGSKVGIRWAGQMTRVLTGESKIYYDLGSLRVIRNAELESQVYGEVLDLANLVQLEDVEENAEVVE